VLLPFFVSVFSNPQHANAQTRQSAPTTIQEVKQRPVTIGRRAVIDVLYKWGPNTNYPGDERTSSFVFMLEDGAWKLDDIYTFRGAFVQAESLSQYLREK
jgi:hypothetical protein